MNKLIIALVVLLSMTFTTQTQASYIKGSMLNGYHDAYMTECGDDTVCWVNSARYGTFVLGTVDALSSTAFLCVPKGVKAKQMIVIVGNYLKANPDKLETEGAVIVFKAVRAVYPCK